MAAADSLHGVIRPIAPIAQNRTVLMTMPFRRVALVVPLASACLYDPELPESLPGASTSGGAASSASVMDASTAPPTTSTSTSTSAGEPTETIGSSTAVTTTGFSSSTSDHVCDDEPTQMQDAGCSDRSGCGCASSHCFVVPAIGGFCSECEADSDCPRGGCTLPNPIALTGAICNEGTVGDGCMSDAACTSPSGPHCAVVLDFSGVITVSTCGECSGECAELGKLCNPVFQIEKFGGYHRCVDPGTIGNDNGCASDSECASGRCGEVNIMGLAKICVCGECAGNADCAMGQQCVDGKVEPKTYSLKGAVCVPNP